MAYFYVERRDGRKANALDYIAAACFSLVMIPIIIIMIAMALIAEGIRRLARGRS